MFLRCKEKMIANRNCDLSINGLYYLCLDRYTGQMHGFYCDNSGDEMVKHKLITRANG